MDRVCGLGPKGARARRSRYSRMFFPAAAVAAAVAVIAGMLVTVALVARPVQAAGPSGCGYGSSGPEASALCWLDMSGYNQSLADSAAGQPMTVSLPGGYTISFTINTGPFAGKTYNPVAATPLPTWSGAYLGNKAYIGAPGQAVRFHFAVTNSGNVTLSNLTVDDTQVASAGALELPPSCPGTSAGMGERTGPTLAPGETIVCTASYVARAADLDRGLITDTARASATAPGSRVATLSASAGLRVGAHAPTNRGTSPSTTSPPITAVSPPATTSPSTRSSS